MAAAEAESRLATTDEEKIDLSPATLELDEREREAVEKLASIVGRSPRAVKRFLNCYRLLKVRSHKGELDSAANDRFKHVLLLRAVVTGTPSISQQFLNALRRGDQVPKFSGRRRRSPPAGSQ